MTLSLDILQRIAAHLKCPVRRDAQSQELADETPVDAIARDLRVRENKEDKLREA